MANITNETATTTTVMRDGVEYMVAEWMGPESDVQGWFVWAHPHTCHYTAFIARCDTRVEAVDWAMGTWKAENYI